ncbi:hypothetical protein BDV97DRAFT_360116 [Delphinella strobiligena]|nr:hypothetical protein BDV97DRAFT_360116 [Delphinella strobiligena]
MYTKPQARVKKGKSTHSWNSAPIKYARWWEEFLIHLYHQSERIWFPSYPSSPP